MDENTEMIIENDSKVDLEKMIEDIFKLQKEQVENSKTPYFKFDIFPNGDCTISCSIPTESNVTAVSNFLTKINQGDFKEPIIKALFNFAQANNATNIIQTIIEKWAEGLKKTQPFMRPLNVLKLST